MNEVFLIKVSKSLHKRLKLYCVKEDISMRKMADIFIEKYLTEVGE